MVAVNMATKVARPGIARREAKHLTVAEVTAVLEASEGLRYSPVLKLIAATGLRRDEAIGLHWRDVNLETGEPKVRYTPRPRRHRAPRHRTQNGAVAANDPVINRGGEAAQIPARRPGRREAEGREPVERLRPGVHQRVRRARRSPEHAAHHRAGVEEGESRRRWNPHAEPSRSGVAGTGRAHQSGRGPARALVAVTRDIYGHSSDETTKAAIAGLTKQLGL